MRLHGDAAGEEVVPDRHRHRVRPARPAVDPRHAPRDGSVTVTDTTSRWACFALWGPRARDVLAPLTPDPLDFPYMSMREIVVGDVPVRALRVTFVGELRVGAVLPDRVRRGAVARAVGGGRAAWPRRRRLPRDRLAAAGEGLPRLGRRHHARRDAARGRAVVLRRARTRSFLGRGRACATSVRRSSAWSASCSRTRARSPWATSRCGRRSTSSAGSPRAATATRSARSIAYAYVPAEHAAPDRGRPSTSSAPGSPAPSPREPLYDPASARVKEVQTGTTTTPTMG